MQLRHMSKHPHQWRRTGLRMWRRFEKVEERMPYIAKMRARRKGVFNARTCLWTHKGAPLEPSEDDLMGEDRWG